MTRSLHRSDHAALIRVLVEARRERGLTQHDLAKKLGKPQSYIAKVEGGERRLDVVEFVDLAKAIGTRPSTLFDRIMEALDAAKA
jgi:transcriptional regulator with XRE-family HTH domain